MIPRGIRAPIVALALMLAFPAARAQSRAADLYAVVLATPANMAQRPAAPLPESLRGKSFYWRLLKSGNAVSYQLCLGFFDTRADAERARQQLAASFREARVIQVNRVERDNLAKAAQKAKPLPSAPPVPPAPPSPAAGLQPATTAAPPPPPAEPAPAGSAEALMAEGRGAITREDYA